jgi:hypothetical protein
MEEFRMTTIALVYFDGCPHVEAARAALRAALGADVEAWTEYRSDDPALPAYARGYGSPSIFVAGREVTGAAPGDTASACRVYRDPAGALVGAPAAETIARAVREAGA